MSEYEYNGLLFDISEKLDVNKLPRLLFICRKDIAEGSEEYIRDVRTLFKELEKQNRIGIDRLENLKEILTQMKKPSLRKKVEEFEIRRKAQSVGIVSSLKRAATCLKGAIKLVCNFRTMAGGLLVVTSGMALRSCSSLEEFVEVFNKVVLVSYSKLAEISEGSLCFTVQAETSSALKELWDMYKGGTLRNHLQEFLVTDEIKQLVSGEDVEVTVYIDEQEYKAAYLDLMLLQKEASDAAKDERLGAQRRSRRNSDSFLCFKSNEDDVTLMKLEQAENKWAFECQRRQFLEEEMKKLRMEIAVVRNAKRRLFCEQEESAQESEDLERRRKRPRRNSDSSVYCKAKDETTAQSEGGAETKHLDSEKYEFIQSYLQNIQETHSMTTETTDSGIRTHGESSDLELQDISDYPFQPCLKDLSKDVTQELSARLRVDQVAKRHIYKSFGISQPFHRSMNIFESFPDTPVKFLKSVFEALQLYDLVDLLDRQKKPQPVRSLRPALPLQEIEKMRKTTDPRPTTYHSNVAALIITYEKDHFSEGVERFFKGLSSKSDVTVIEWKAQADRPLSRFEEQDETKVRWKKQEIQNEMEANETAVSGVIERWIHSQGDFSLFAVFATARNWWDAIIQKVMKRLASGTPAKIKFVTGVSVPISFSETLVVSRPPLDYNQFERLILDILNKRWQTIDLISMMEECKRLMHLFSYFERLSITDRLSSRPRFKKEEDPTDCA